MNTSKAGRRGPRIVVRRSGIHGRGVFARRLLREGETVCEYKGERVSEAEIARRYPEDMDGLNHTFVFALEYVLTRMLPCRQSIGPTRRALASLS